MRNDSIISLQFSFSAVISPLVETLPTAFLGENADLLQTKLLSALVANTTYLRKRLHNGVLLDCRKQFSKRPWIEVYQGDPTYSTDNMSDRKNDLIRIRKLTRALQDSYAP